jgi:hypothetical protein
MRMLSYLVYRVLNVHEPPSLCPEIEEFTGVARQVKFEALT